MLQSPLIRAKPTASLLDPILPISLAVLPRPPLPNGEKASPHTQRTKQPTHPG